MFEKVKRKTRFGRKFWCLLLIACPIAVFSIIFSPVLASLSLTPSIEIDTVHGVLYDVTDDGETAIRVTGTMNRVSIATCNFRLEIPSSFEMDTLADGSPIMEMLANGSSVETTQDDTEFGAVFVLKTYNSTLLPKRYMLKINSTSINYIGFITPQWPQQEPTNPEGGGGGAGITSLYPEIQKLRAFDSEKGEKEHVRTWIYNPTQGGQYLERLRYQILADDYADWQDWTPYYSENKFIGDGETYIVDDYLDYIFTSPIAPYKKYALNIGNLEPNPSNLKYGDYKVTSVRAEGIGFIVTYAPGYRGQFYVKPLESGTYLVFVVYCMNDEWYDLFYLNPALYIEFASIFFEHDYDIILYPGPEFTWDPPSYYTTSQLLNLLQEEGKDALGLDGDWTGRAGTHLDNHGFDVLAGFTGYRSDHYGLVLAPNNYLVVTGGNALVRLTIDAIDNVFQHELSHCYDAKDRWDYEWWDGQPSVMSKPIGVTTFNHWGYTDHGIIDENSDQFDGYAYYA